MELLKVIAPIILGFGMLFLFLIGIEQFLTRKERQALKERGRWLIVTPNDIAQGQRHSKCHCPIALAMQRQFPETCRTVTNSKLTVWDSRGDAFIKPSPPAVQKFVDDFDAGKSVEPCVFKFPPLDFWTRVPAEQLSGTIEDKRS